MYETTIAYPPDALSTYVGPLWMPDQTGPAPESLYKAINYTEFQEYQANTKNAGYSKNLKIPSDLAAIDPAWRTCTPGMYGSWDPPRVLTAARNMVTPTAAQAAADPSETAAPAAGIAPTDIPAAPTPAPKDPASSSLNSDPPSVSDDPDPNSEVSQSKGSSDPDANEPLKQDAPKQDPPSVSTDPGSKSKDSQSIGNGNPSADDPSKQDSPSVSVNTVPKSANSQSKGNSDPAANDPLKQDPSSASADTNSVSEGSQSKENSDPALSVGQEDDPSRSGDAGDNQTPASKQGQDSDPAKQQDGSENTPPEQHSPGASSPATSDGSSENTNNQVVGPSLSVNPQGSQNSPKVTLLATDLPLSPDPVVLASPTPLIVSGNTIQKATNGGAVIGTSTFTAGYEGKLSDVPISVGVDNIVIGTTTHALPTSAPVLIGGQSIVKATNGGVIIGTSTYSSGSQAQISGQKVSVGVDSVVVGGTSYAIPTPSTADTALVDKLPISRGPDGVAMVGGATIGVGSQSSINGHVVSVGASIIVLDGTSYALPSSAGAILQSPSPQQNSPVTLMNGAVLTPGGNVATVSGTTYAIPHDDSGLVVNGQAVPFPTVTSLKSVFTVADQTFTAAPTGFVIGGQSVALDGTAATVDGTVVSLGPSGVQIGSKTMPLTSAQTTQDGLGGFIMSGFGSGVQPGQTAGSRNGSSVLAFTGDSSRLGQQPGIVLFEIIFVILGIIFSLI